MKQGVSELQYLQERRKINKERNRLILTNQWLLPAKQFLYMYTATAPFTRNLLTVHSNINQIGHGDIISSILRTIISQRYGRMLVIFKKTDNMKQKGKVISS